MAKQQKRPAVVAELGRPETPGETAARKANDSRLYRERKTVNNLVFSLIVSAALMIGIVLMAPGLTGGKNSFDDHSVDVAELALNAAPGAGRSLAAPEVPEAWKAKSAGLRQSDGVTSWQINYTTVDPLAEVDRYAAVVQGFTADGSPVPEKWVAQQLEQQAATGTELLGGIDWTVYEHTDRNPDSSNMLFGMQGEWAGDTVLVYGTDDPSVIRVLATQVAESLAAQPVREHTDSAAEPAPTAEEQ